jgi:precorrin-6B methylase 2
MVIPTFNPPHKKFPTGKDQNIMETTTSAEVRIDPSKIMQIGMGFWASKTLLTAINLELFTLLAKGKLNTEQIREKLGLHERSIYDFLDTLVSLGFLTRDGKGTEATYGNSAETDMFLDKGKPSYMGGILEMSNHRLYPFWHHLEDALRTGKPQNEARTGERPMFEVLYEDENRLKEFIAAMGGIQMGNFIEFARRFDFSGYSTFCDAGGAGGFLCAQVAIHNPHMKCTSFDLPKVGPIATGNMKAMGVDDRVTVMDGDFFKDDLPKSDVIAMGNVLHDWGIDDKKKLISKAYDALPDGGALVVIENIIDNDRSKNTFGLLMSLNMAIETPEGFDFTASDFDSWAKEAGFSSTYVMPLTGPTSAAVAVK